MRYVFNRFIWTRAHLVTKCSVRFCTKLQLMNVEHKANETQYTFVENVRNFYSHDEMQTDHRCCTFFVFLHSISSIYSQHTIICGECAYAFRLCCQLTYKNVYLHNSLSTITKRVMTAPAVENTMKPHVVWLRCGALHCRVCGSMAHCGFNLSGIRKRKLRSENAAYCCVHRVSRGCCLNKWTVTPPPVW